LEENALGRLRCASVGGYPPPELSVFVGDRDVTPLFTQSTAATLHGARGLRLMVHQTVLWTDQLTVTAADDGQTARCVATVSGLGANVTYIRITVNCKSSAFVLGLRRLCTAKAIVFCVPLSRCFSRAGRRAGESITHMRQRRRHMTARS